MKTQMDRITIDTDILAGKPVITGTQISVELILDKIAGGMDMDEILVDYPRLKKQDIQAALHYAKQFLGKEEYYPLPFRL